MRNHQPSFNAKPQWPDVYFLGTVTPGFGESAGAGPFYRDVFVLTDRDTSYGVSSSVQSMAFMTKPGQHLSAVFNSDISIDLPRPSPSSVQDITFIQAYGANTINDFGAEDHVLFYNMGAGATSADAVSRLTPDGYGGSTLPLSGGTASVRFLGRAPDAFTVDNFSVANT